MAKKVYPVTGMSCEHCVRAVSDEVGKLAGVRGVEVDLASGRVSVVGDGFTDEQIRDAVDEAGYVLVDA